MVVWTDRMRQQVRRRRCFARERDSACREKRCRAPFRCVQSMRCAASEPEGQQSRLKIARSRKKAAFEHGFHSARASARLARVHLPFAPRAARNHAPSSVMADVPESTASSAGRCVSPSFFRCLSRPATLRLFRLRLLTPRRYPCQPRYFR